MKNTIIINSDCLIVDGHKYSGFNSIEPEDVLKEYQLFVKDNLRWKNNVQNINTIGIYKDRILFVYSWSYISTARTIDPNEHYCGIPLQEIIDEYELFVRECANKKMSKAYHTICFGADDLYWTRITHFQMMDWMGDNDVVFRYNVDDILNEYWKWRNEIDNTVVVIVVVE